MVSENIAGFYLEQLKSCTNPGAVLVKFYSAVFEKEFNKDLIGHFTQIVRLYGRENVFFAILDIADNETLNHDTIYRLIAHIAKRRLEEKDYGEVHRNLSKDLENISKRARRIKRSKVEARSPFDE